MSDEAKKTKETKEITQEESTGKVTYANDVIAKIAALAAGEVKGIIGTSGGSIKEMLGVKNLTKGLKVTVVEQTASIELHVIVEYGSQIHKVCEEVQGSITRSIESMTDLKVVNVDVHVEAIRMPEEKTETEE